MAHDKPYRDIDERPKRFKKDKWASYWNAILDNTKFVKMRKAELEDCISYSNLGIKKIKMMKKLKLLVKRRKVRKSKSL